MIDSVKIYFWIVEKLKDKMQEENKNFNTHSTSKCPFCDKEYKDRVAFKRHIRLRHDLGFILGLIGLLLTIIILFWGENILGFIDEIGEIPKAYLAMEVYYPIKINTSYIGKEEHKYLIQRQRELGIIPQWTNLEPMLWRVTEDDKMLGCNYWAFGNANDKIKIDNKEYNQFMFRIPGGNFLSTLSSCTDCLGYAFYMINTGTSFIKKTDIKICAKNSSKIQYSSKDVIQETDNCFRVIGEDLPPNDSNSSILGYVILSDINKKSRADFWDKNIFPVFEGDIKRLRKKIEVTQDMPSRIVNVFIPNVTC